MDKITRMRLSVYCGFLAPIIAYILIFISIANAPWFTWQHNALSDLGAHPGSDVTFNAGLMVAGVLYFVFSVNLFTYYKREEILNKIGSIFLIIDSIALFCIGLFPETAGIIHYYVSVVFFVMFPLGFLILSIGYIYHQREKIVAIVAFIGFVASAIIWGFPWKAYGITGVAIPEFTSSLFATTWVALVAYKIYTELRSGS
ncbi:MAG: DUF998 domain-containing protein [Candidatus Asgardarchaeia archaeon]